MTHSYRFPTIQGVISHLQNDHNMEIGNQTHSFEISQNSMNGKYKRTKHLNHATYRIHQLNCTVVLYKYWYLYCNRSGHGTGCFKGEGKRLTKSQGSCKTQKSCITHMKVMQDIATGQVVVEYCPTRNNHSVELAHLPAPTDIKHKVVYLNNKQNRCVDRLLHVLLCNAHNLIFKQLQKMEKGKMTHRKCEINKRHKDTIELRKYSTLYLSQDTNTWKIESLNAKGTFYILQQPQQECDCPLCCSMCNACVHVYTCTYMDATLHSTVCKRMHLLHMTIFRQEDGYKVIQNMNKTLEDEKDDDMTEYNSKSEDKETESEY